MPTRSPPRRRVALLLALAVAVSCSSGGSGRTASPADGAPIGPPSTGAAGTPTTATTATTTANTPPASPDTGPRTTRAPAASRLPGSPNPAVTTAPPTLIDAGTWTMGGWQPAGRSVGGSAAVYTTTMQNSPGGTSVAVAQLDTARLRLVFYAGTGPAQDTVPGSLVATFNSGFQTNQARGGWYVNGAALGGPLRPGAASLVIFADGSATVGEWGRDVQLIPGVVAVRQNLALMVDGSRPVPGLTGSTAGLLAAWGYTLNNRLVTWRSAVGVDGVGHLLYVAGPALDPATLASALVAAGATRAMELDINPAWVSFNTFTDGPGGAAGAKLLPAMNFPTNHYLTNPGGRDFFAAFARY